MHGSLSLVATSLLVLTGAPEAQAIALVPDGFWTGGFEVRGTDSTVKALCVYDDGSGPALYVGGSFGIAGGVASWGIARWNGSVWESVGSLDPARDVLAMTVFDDGVEEVLVIVGDFNQVGGVPASKIATWNGSEWRELGGGIQGLPSSVCTVTFPAGDLLFVGGAFTTVGDGVSAKNIARWDGEAWSALSGGIQQPVTSVARFQGSLYAGCIADTPGLVPTLQRFDGNEWLALTEWPNASVRALLVLDDGAGERLFAGGAFTSIRFLVTGGVAAFDGASWSAVGTAPLGTVTDPADVRALTVHSTPGGDQLVAVGTIPGDPLAVELENVAVWDGAAWSAVGGGAVGIAGTGWDVISTDLGGGLELFVGGAFVVAGGRFAAYVASTDGATWSPLGQGAGLPGEVEDLCLFDDGNGPVLHAAGNFGALGGAVRWSGGEWRTFGGGIESEVRELLVWDDGTGSALYAGGLFQEAGGAPANGIARWDGTSWNNLSGGVDGFGLIEALAVHDDGGGPALYAGGGFSSIGGVPAESIARWDGDSWSPAGAGLSFGVQDLAEFDDGTGPALYAGGSFNVVGPYLARFQNGVWAPLPGGTSNTHVNTLFPVDDPQFGGRALIVGGLFGTIGGVTARGVALWKPGVGWSAFGAGIRGSVPALALIDTPGGSQLIAGGQFTDASSVTRWGILRWTGRKWIPLDGGLGGTFTPYRTETLEVFEIGGLEALWVGGWFDFAGTNVSGNLDVWLEFPARATR